MKEWASRIGEAVFWTFVALSVARNLFNWMAGIDDGRPHEGQQCGPAHHWVYQRSNVTDPDLSCEAD